MSSSVIRFLGLAAVVPILILTGCDDLGEDRGPADAEETGEVVDEQYQAPSVDGERTQRRTAEPGSADADAASGADAESEEAAVVPTGTVMTVRLEESVSTESHEVGDEFGAAVTQDVRGEDREILIPEGSRVTGVVEQSRRSAGPEEQAILAFRLQSVEVDGASYPLDATVQDATPERSEGDSGAETAAKIAIGTAAGALIGQVLGSDTESTLGGAAAGAAAGTIVALSTRSGDATMNEGSSLRVQLNEPIRLTPRSD